MSSKSNSFLKVSTLVWILFFSLTGSFAKGNPHTADTTKNSGAASPDTPSREANLIFPDVLIGNEEESLSYIEKFSSNRRAYVIRTYNKGKKYFPQVTAILKKHDLPHELKVLMALESAFNANAVSRAGAVGYWQFMDRVAREYGLRYTVKRTPVRKKHSKKLTYKVRYVKDDRRNFNKSTYAAARYLKDRSRNLNNDLLLMVASYNCGVGNVWEAMKKSGKEDPTFWDIKKYLPAETRAYVMNFITLNVLFHNYEKFANNTLNFKAVKIEKEERDEEEEVLDDKDSAQVTAKQK